MTAAMRHRGPDDEGIHCDPEAGVCLGVRRLSIIDVAHGRQPVGNEDGSIWAVLNGELYNHPTLKDRLRGRGHRLASEADTAVLPHLYEEYGRDLVHALEGMFALAIWDARSKRLLVARDRFGEKPLSFCEHGSRLSFASELKALIEAGLADADVDAEALDDYFVYGYVPGSRTILREVRQLPPGTILEWSHACPTAKLQRYWHPAGSPNKTAEPFEDLVDEVRARLASSVRSRMIADVPLGIFLSGGLDSTLVTALAVESSAQRVKTFTVTYAEGRISEKAPALRAATALGTEHHELLLEDRDVERDLPRALGRLDQPIADPALFPLYSVSRLARDTVTVAVGGEGADELFAGYPRYRWLQRAAVMDHHLPERPRATAARALARFLPQGRIHRLVDVLEPKPPLLRHLAWVTGGRLPLRSELYGPRLRHLTQRDGYLSSLTDPFTAADDETLVGRLMTMDIHHWLSDDVLQKADRAGMLCSLEIRTPYLNRDLAELARSIPPAIHMSNGGKAVLRAVLRGVLADRGVTAPWLSRRAKTAFRAPTAQWLRGPLAALMHEQLAEGSLFEEGWFDARKTRVLAREHLQVRRDWSAALWPILVAGVWLDEIRGRGAG
jgi:asparagine synthase (glutamine-hydrolysing)